MIKTRSPELAVDGEMNRGAALSRAVLDDLMSGSTLKREANLLIMPNVDAANIVYNPPRAAAGGGTAVDGILRGAAR